MPKPVEIENIEDMRRREGIVDVELQNDIRALHIGDVVRLTLLSQAKSLASETVFVRITSIRGDDFRGKLANRPACSGLSKLRVGTPVIFTKAHIHSLPKALPAKGR
jgi:hypothetical protein